MKSKSQIIVELRETLKEIKEAKLLPKDYGAIVSEKLEIPKNKVYRTMSGKNSDLDVMEAIIELAENSREKQLLERAKKVLED